MITLSFHSDQFDIRFLQLESFPCQSFYTHVIVYNMITIIYLSIKYHNYNCFHVIPLILILLFISFLLTLSNSYDFNSISFLFVLFHYVYCQNISDCEGASARRTDTGIKPLTVLRLDVTSQPQPQTLSQSIIN